MSYTESQYQFLTPGSDTKTLFLIHPSKYVKTNRYNKNIFAELHNNNVYNKFDCKCKQ